VHRLVPSFIFLYY